MTDNFINCPDCGNAFRNWPGTSCPWCLRGTEIKRLRKALGVVYENMSCAVGAVDAVSEDECLHCIAGEAIGKETGPDA